MDPERPPEIDAEYRVVHGPWPRWFLHISLMKLGLWVAGVVALCILAFAVAVAALRI